MELKKRIDLLFNEKDLWVLQGFTKVSYEDGIIIYELTSDHYGIVAEIKGDLMTLILKIEDDEFLKDFYYYSEYMEDFYHNIDILYQIMEIYKDRDM